MKYYHVTFKSRLKNIQTEGLCLGSKRIWKNMVGGTLGERNKVYLTDDMDAAIRWAGHMEWSFKRPIVILELENVPGNIEPDEHPQSMGRWVTTDAPIPPSSIVKVVPVSQQTFKDFVTRQREMYSSEK